MISLAGQHKLLVAAKCKKARYTVYQPLGHTTHKPCFCVVALLYVQLQANSANSSSASDCFLVTSFRDWNFSSGTVSPSLAVIGWNPAHWDPDDQP